MDIAASVPYSYRSQPPGGLVYPGLNFRSPSPLEFALRSGCGTLLLVKEINFVNWL